MKSIKRLIEDYGNPQIDYGGVLASKDEEFSDVVHRHFKYSLFSNIALDAAYEGIEHSYNQVQSCFLKEVKS